MKRALLLCTITLGSLLLFSPSSKASEWEQGPIQEQLARSPQWSSYSPRQRAIAVAIAHIADTYYAQTAKPLPVTPETVALVMHSIEATPADTAFIYDQMYTHSLAKSTFSQADSLLDQLHQHIQTQ